MYNITPFARFTDQQPTNVDRNQLQSIIYVESLYYCKYVTAPIDCIVEFFHYMLRRKGVIYFADFCIQRSNLDYSGTMRQTFFEHHTEFNEFVKMWCEMTSNMCYTI